MRRVGTLATVVGLLVVAINLRAQSFAAPMIKDCHGREVRVGSRIRILKIAAFLQRDLPSDEWAELQSMVGEVFEVTEIDERGRALIEKLFDAPPGETRSREYAMEPDEMEVVTE